MDRPDLTDVDPKIRAYIEYLESQVKSKPSSGKERTHANILPDEYVDRIDEQLPSELPTTLNIISISKSGLAKRTARHLYSRQHRGGMGIFDLDVASPDYPAILSCADENQNLILFSNTARAFRLNASKISATPVRSKGDILLQRIALEPEEYIVAVLPEQASGYVAMASASGRVRCLRHHLFGEHMKPGTAMYQFKEFGPLVSACWTPGESDLFVATQNGLAIRFSEKLVPPQGDLGIRLASDDAVVGITSVYPDSGVFLLAADGKGTVRLMSGFAPNKSMGGSGKLAIKCQKLVGVTAIEENDDLFIITRQSKIIRFKADEVPGTEGVIQGVNCISMRVDEVATVIKTGLIQT
jgi:DNA gyrase subunit A